MDNWSFLCRDHHPFHLLFRYRKEDPMVHVYPVASREIMIFHELIRPQGLPDYSRVVKIWIA